MTQDSVPITPTPELVEQWCNKWTIANGDFGPYLATQAARWGADQELEACCEWLATTAMTKPWQTVAELALELRAARRPKPPSLKERAMQAMDRVDVIWATDEFGKETMDDINAIRRALESLPD